MPDTMDATLFHMVMTALLEATPEEFVVASLVPPQRKPEAWLSKVEKLVERYDAGALRLKVHGVDVDFVGVKNS